MTHTPGPFKAEGGAIKAVSHGRWFTVARVDRGKFTPEGREANAAFLAHAGTHYEELLEAAKDVVQQAEKTKMMLPADLADSIRVFLRVAIKKAEGRE